jgi:hypothetical protein
MWTEANEILAERLSQHIGAARFVILADESNGPVNAPAKYEKIAYKASDMPSMDLPNEPAGSV